LIDRARSISNTATITARSLPSSQASVQCPIPSRFRDRGAIIYGS
jgi:hypothetical protein